MPKKTIAVLTTFQGHLSIAIAITQNLTGKYQVANYSDNDILLRYYLPIYRFFPSSFGSIYKLSHNKKTTTLAQHYFKTKYEERIKKFFSNKKPDLIINTHYFYNKCLDDISAPQQIPYINVLTDPKSVHPLLISEKATYNLAFNKQAKQTAKKLNAKANVIESGWFVRNEYEQDYDKQQVRKKLKLPADRLTFLIVSGSDGTNAVTKILPAFFASKKTITVLVACGNNKTLFNIIKSLEKNIIKYRKNIDLIPIPFTKKLYEYMQAADLIVGKAGPNTLFESVATLTPFFAITHISGQETGNLDIIRNYHLGYVEEKPLRAAKKILNIIDKPQQLDRFKTPLQKMKQYNQASKSKLLQLIEKLLTKPN